MPARGSAAPPAVTSSVKSPSMAAFSALDSDATAAPQASSI
jgi:hypothetical protein